MIGELAVMSRVAGSTKTYVDDVFSAYTYTGNGATQTITNGIDLAGKGGAVWIKSRDVARNHLLSCPTGTDSDYLVVNSTDAKAYDSSRVSAFTSAGFSVGSSTGTNGNAEKYVSWTFRKAAKFFDVVTYTGNGVAGRTIAHSLGVAPGMIAVKRTDVVGSWMVYHNSIANTENLVLNTTAAKVTDATAWNSTTATASVFSLGTHADVNANTGTYVAYLFAHDTATDGIIQCGSYTGTGADNNAVTLGFEPQFLMIKRASGGTGSWIMADTMRGIATPTVYDTPATVNYLAAETSSAETASFTFGVTATGFNLRESNTQLNNNGDTYIYLAIRRINKPPTSGTQVYNAIARTGTGAAATVTGVGFAPDLLMAFARNDVSNHGLYDRLIGANRRLTYNLNDAEYADTTGVTAFEMDGVSIGNSSLLNSTFNYINHFFRRAPGVFDEVCYTGTGAAHTEAHNLGVVPELMIVKKRNVSEIWCVYSASLPTTSWLRLDSSWSEQTGAPTNWNSSTPTSTSFSLGTSNYTNNTNDTYVAYLFATKAGISKVGSYSGNGTSQIINCGFAAGARFILIKRTDSTGDWYVWDTVRGIVAGNDPHLSLNTIAAEVTTDDSIDPDTSGFVVNQVAATNINVTSATYIFLAVA